MHLVSRILFHQDFEFKLSKLTMGCSKTIFGYMGIFGKEVHVTNCPTLALSLRYVQKSTEERKRPQRKLIFSYLVLQKIIKKIKYN